MNTVFLSYSPTGSPAFTAGVILFEVSDDGGTTYYGVAATKSIASTADGALYLNGQNTARAWQFNVSGTTNFRVRLAIAITGAGTLNLRATASSGGDAPLKAFFPLTANTYIAYRAVASGAAVDLLSLFVAGGSTRSVHIRRISIGLAHTAAVGPIMSNIQISKTNTVGTTCTSVTIQPLDSTNEPVPSTVTANGACTTDPVVVFTISSCTLMPEEGSTANTTSENVICYEYNPNLSQPITLRASEGLMLKTVATLAATGTLGITIWFTIS